MAGLLPGGVDEVPSTLEGDHDTTEEPPPVAVLIAAMAEDNDDLAEDPIVATMLFKFSILGAATNTVLGERKRLYHSLRVALNT